MRLLGEIKENHQTYILALLIISGPIKPMFNAFIGTLDVTLFAFSLAAIDIIFQLGQKENRIRINKQVVLYLSVLFFIFLLMFLSFFYSSSEIYAREKFLKFSLTIFCFVYPIFVKEINWKSFVRGVLWIVIPLSFLFIYYRQFFWSDANAANRSFSDKFYDIAGSYMGLGYVISLVGFVFVEKKKWFSLGGLYLVLLAMGSRGPLLFSLLTIFIVKYKIFLNVKFKTKRVLIFLSFLIAGCGIIIAKFDFFKEKIYKYGLDRFISLFSSDRKDASANDRIELMSYAIDQIFSNPKTFIFGNGIGSFGYDYLGKDVKENPHNIFLEAWYELGVLGLFLIAFFLITPFFINKKLALYKAFIFFAFFNCLKSNNLSGLWILVVLYSIYLNNIKMNPKLNEVRVS
ncbi:O-antigen ligase family protein [Pseudofulvibacter geojedonensis]|uniref:O-antigen ligase family protein n=1 Tax=Pseudofulvibacter geojedonensis TaxID=1123758 RepID=A0ABW3I3Z6_9FLAO